MFTYMYAGEAKERSLSRTKDVHAMSREKHKESKETLAVEQKGNAMSHYTLANQCSTLCSTMLRAMKAGHKIPNKHQSVSGTCPIALAVLYTVQ